MNRHLIILVLDRTIINFKLQKLIWKVWSLEGSGGERGCCLWSEASLTPGAPQNQFLHQPLGKDRSKTNKLVCLGLLKEIWSRSCTHCWLWKGLGSLCTQQDTARGIPQNLGQHRPLPSHPSSGHPQGEAKPPKNKSWGDEPEEGRSKWNPIIYPQWSVAQITFFKV